MAQVDSENSTAMPADGADALYFPTDTTPEELFQAIGGLRRQARDEINRLIQFLDSTENHMAIDCEPEDDGDDAEDEPGLGSFDRMADQSKAWRQQSLWAFPVVDGEYDAADTEPFLGALEGQTDQTGWAVGHRGDREQDPAESGIGDPDGVNEQIGRQDWQPGVMG